MGSGVGWSVFHLVFTGNMRGFISYLVYLLQEVLQVTTVLLAMPSLSSWFSAPWVGRHHKSVSDPSGPAGLEVWDLLPRFPGSSFPPYSLRYPFPVAVFLFPRLRRFSSGSWEIPLFIGPRVGSELREEVGFLPMISTGSAGLGFMVYAGLGSFQSVYAFGPT